MKRDSRHLSDFEFLAFASNNESKSFFLPASSSFDNPEKSEMKQREKLVSEEGESTELKKL
jgi:hypothetical protein